MASQRSAARLEDKIASLGDLSRQELAERWQTHFKTPPPKGIRRPLMVRALAYQLQAKRWGGLRRDTARQLRAVAFHYIHKKHKHLLPKLTETFTQMKREGFIDKVKSDFLNK